MLKIGDISITILAMERRKSLLLTISAMLLGIILLGVLFFSVPLVVFVEPDVPGMLVSRLLPEAGVGEGYLRLHMKMNTLRLVSSFRKPNLVVYTPFTVPDESLGKSLQWGTLESSATICVPLEEERLWHDALSHLGDKPVAFLYNLFDSKKKDLFKKLQSEYPNLEDVTYDGFVNTFIQNDLKAQLDSFYAVLVVSPEETSEVYRITSSRVVMDFRYASAAVTLDRVISVTPDWNQIIKEALKMTSGEISSDYTLSVLGK